MRDRLEGHHACGWADGLAALSGIFTIQTSSWAQLGHSKVRLSKSSLSNWMRESNICLPHMAQGGRSIRSRVSRWWLERGHSKPSVELPLVLPRQHEANKRPRHYVLSKIFMVGINLFSVGSD